MKVQCNVKIDKDVKDEAKPILDAMGLSLSAYISVCMHQLIIQQGIPFDVTAREAKPVEKPTLSDVKDKAETVEKDLSPTEEKGKRKSKTAKALAQFDF